MNRILLTLALPLTPVLCWAAEPNSVPARETKLTFTVWPGHIPFNEPKTENSYLIITDQEGFDKVFGINLFDVEVAASQSICPEFSQFEYLAGGASGKGAVTKVDCEATRELAAVLRRPRDESQGSRISARPSVVARVEEAVPDSGPRLRSRIAARPS